MPIQAQVFIDVILSFSQQNIVGLHIPILHQIKTTRNPEPRPAFYLQKQTGK
ncbi:MAG: hypothetical protein ACI8PP_002589 [Candidatus Pseudothioglobus sp.]|jgi:hypothetical protein